MNISKGYSPAYKFASYGPFNSYDPTYTGLNDMMMLWDPNDVGYNPNNPFRNSRARYFLPSLDEWFKAAFYDPTLNSGNGGYWDFPTTSNTAPTPVPGGTVGAVYDSQTGPANVDDAGSLSWYGTMAQGGNVYELAETAFDLNNNDINKNRAVVGGGWGDPATKISSDFMFSSTPSAPNDSYGIGFRVAMVVEPPDSDLDQDGVNYYRELKDGTNPNDATSFNPLSKGLVAYYPLNGNADDESGYSKTGTIYGGIFEVGRSCGSNMAFNTLLSTSNRIVTPVNTGQGTKWTFSAWFKTTVGGAIVGDDLSGQHLCLLVHTLESGEKGQLKFGIFDEDIGVQIQTADKYDDGKWHHVTAIFDSTPGQPSSSQFTLYINGSKATNLIPDGNTGNDMVSVPLPSGAATLGFNRKEVTGIYNIASSITVQDVRFYDRNLSEDETKLLFYSEAFTSQERSFLSANPSVMGHFSSLDYQLNRTNGQSDVTTNPSAFGLVTQAEYDTSRTAGQNDVLSDPSAYNLYNSDSIMDLNMGGVMIQKQGSSVTLSLEVQKTDNLGVTPFSPYGTFLLPVTVPGNKSFLRVRALPNPTPALLP
jgi:hypothetical protein